MLLYSVVVAFFVKSKACGRSAGVRDRVSSPSFRVRFCAQPKDDPLDAAEWSLERFQHRPSSMG